MSGWVRSSFCAGNGSCIEVRHLPIGVFMRSTRLLQMMGFTPDEWGAFVAGVKAGEFDAPPEHA
jgi:Domain of unknown function (DUF397)